MEPAPWIKDYEVEMDKLYCELTLEKLENEVSGVKGQPLANYKELFDEHCELEKDVEITESGPEKKVPVEGTKISGAWKSVRRRAKKVLGIGNPGIEITESGPKKKVPAEGTKISGAWKSVRAKSEEQKRCW